MNITSTAMVFLIMNFYPTLCVQGGVSGDIDVVHVLLDLLETAASTSACSSSNTYMYERMHIYCESERRQCVRRKDVRTILFPFSIFHFLIF